MGRSDGLHRLRSALARVQAEAELMELDGTAIDGVRGGLENAFAALESLEAPALVGMAVVLEDEERLGALTVRALARLGQPAVLALALEPALRLAAAGATLVADLSVVGVPSDSERRALRAARPIIVSGAGGDEAHGRADDLLARAYFLKPVQPKQLVDAIAATRSAGGP